MKRVWVRQWNRATEAEETANLLNGISEKNLLDPGIFDYANITVIKGYTDEKTVLVMPVHSVFMCESLGISPAASSTETAAGLRNAFEAVVWESRRNGQGEIWFGCRDEETIKFAEHNGFERVNYPMFRMKVK